MKQLLLLLTAFSFFSAIHAQKDTNDFVTTWRTTNFGQGGDSSVVIPIDTNYTYNFDVDWDNDGVFDDLGVTDTIAHLYPDTGTYTVRIRGTFPRFFVFLIGNPTFGVSGDEKLISLEQWGNNAWQNVEYMFWTTSYFTYNATDAPNLSQVTSLEGMFSQNLNFNGNLSNWNVSNITNLQLMFELCQRFNQPLNSWDVSNVNNFAGLFRATAYNQPLNAWDMSSALSTELMFERSDFNQPIDNWDVSRVLSMTGMFEDGVFNQPLNNWQTDSVIFMHRMFKDNRVFNQPLNNWNTSNVTNMFGMFENATAFNQDIGNFDLSSIPITLNSRLNKMLDSTNLSITNYDSTLIKWARQSPQCCLQLGAAGLKYCTADSARNFLTTVLPGGPNWTILGDIFDCLGVGAEEVALQEQVSFNVYPNPSSDKIFIERNASITQLQEVFIYNVQGQQVYAKTISQNKEAIDVSQFKSGIYLLRLGEKSKRIVVQ